MSGEKSVGQSRIRRCEPKQLLGQLRCTVAGRKTPRAAGYLAHRLSRSVNRLCSSPFTRAQAGVQIAGAQGRGSLKDSNKQVGSDVDLQGLSGAGGFAVALMGALAKGVQLVALHGVGEGPPTRLAGGLAVAVGKGGLGLAAHHLGDFENYAVVRRLVGLSLLAGSPEELAVVVPLTGEGSDLAVAVFGA